MFSYPLPGWYPTVNAVLIHPTDPLTWLLSHDGEVNGTWGAYIYRSTDGGTAWTDVYSITGDAINSLVTSPVTPTTIYATTSNDNFYRSADAGATWTAVITDGSAGGSLVLDPPDTLYALSGSDVRQSTDEGDTWITVGQVPGDARGPVIDLGPTPGALYAGGSERGVHKSTDGGVNWEERNDGIESLVQPRDIDVDPQNLARMFVAAECGGGWMTVDGGEGWTQLDDLPGCMGSFAVNPGDPDVVYAGAYNCGGASIFRSGDGGLTFEPVYTATFIVSDCSGGDEAIYTLAVAPATTRTVYAAGRDQPDWQDERAVVLHSADDGASWTPVFTLPARSSVHTLAVDPADPQVAYVGGEDCSGPECEGVVYRTVDGGGQWTHVFTATETVVRSIVVDHRDPNILYVADDGYRVYKSIDGGDHWTTVRRPPWEGGDVSGNLLAIDDSLPTHVYLGGWGYVAETRDRGETWSGWNDPINQGTPEMAPMALVVDNGTLTQTLYAGFSGVWAYSRLAPQPFRIYLPLVMRNS